ncbi:hypothetical protein B5V88_08915 [Heyndrickxia sporothermodurans]|uniref:hypothetical protein n=3 Tax=Heyndrickxia sporothermodurans TaxID=46224 RepID=UPI000D38D728|nr:hypothetical protein [Heyndrickxia sporothermodurans]MBL5772773.1 hypothetical protein [Heyndrickxia sporothermodurans]PTY79247.1 hypothetical protein B5V88_08915 [Heyndrickxia sporothermodurans]PTY89591.1 hypothetical protein B5V90_07550 [Heyndrickxia sporothermodurans]
MNLGRQRGGMNPKMGKENESWSSKRKNEAEDALRKEILVVKEKERIRRWVKKRNLGRQRGGII